MATSLERHGLAIVTDVHGKKVRKRLGLGIDNSIRTLRTGLSAKRAEQRRFGWGRQPSLVTLLGAPQKRRTIYDAKKSQQLPGIEIRSEGEPPVSDADVNRAYDYLGSTFDLYWDVYERNSIDDAGMELEGTVHFGINYDNAFWDGRRMVFGDGDGVVFDSFTKSIDVIGHELTHGVVEHEPGLIYWGQPGALNESLADVFGSLVKQYQLNEKARDADWLIGADLFKPGVNAKGIRWMKFPGQAYNDARLGGQDPQPDRMSKYVRTFEDNGGVHINSGIPNRAFYVTAYELDGFAWERAGVIWYETMISPFLGPTARFSRFARLTLLTARQLFGMDSEEERAVRKGWDAVEISV
jgi:Zn-dependent metalloprotease